MPLMSTKIFGLHSLQWSISFISTVQPVFLQQPLERPALLASPLGSSLQLPQAPALRLQLSPSPMANSPALHTS